MGARSSLEVLAKTARRRAQISKKPNQTEANRSEPTSSNHHPNAFIFLALGFTHCICLGRLQPDLQIQFKLHTFGHKCLLVLAELLQFLS
ncbi:hypothetical protein V6N13_057032 [Hibiscus sabdariffa]|uniref:Uncharacterized protein n=1 Tax=Hibiscus sabdariffa TaxID=183260 RepID=A0ABR2D5G4_9ROSI